MATEKQIEANRANAQRSTGPRTEEGKAASSRNNLRHGLTARGFIVVAGDEDAFAELEAGLLERLVPEGPLQEVIFKRALESAWNLERCRHATVDLQASANNPEADPLIQADLLPRLAAIQRYAREAESSLYKAIRELGKIQSEIQYRHENFPLSDAEIQDDKLFQQTPHALSEVCNFSLVMSTVVRQSRIEAKTRAIVLGMELEACAKLHPHDDIRRHEGKWPPAQAQPAQKTASETRERAFAAA